MHDAGNLFQCRENFLPVYLVERVGGHNHHSIMYLQDCPGHIEFVLENGGGITGDVRIVSRDRCLHKP